MDDLGGQDARELDTANRAAGKRTSTGVAKGSGTRDATRPLPGNITTALRRCGSMNNAEFNQYMYDVWVYYSDTVPYQV